MIVERKLSSYLNLWCWIMTLAPFWWMCGLNLFVYQVTAFALFSFLIYDSSYKGRGIYVPFAFWPLFLMVVVYLFSLAVRGPESRDFLRVVASVYNLSFWIMGCFLVLVLGGSFVLEDIPAVNRVFIWLGIMICAVALIVFIAPFFRIQNISWATPIYGLTRLLGHTSLIEQTLMVTPLRMDYFASSTYPRFSFLAPYPTATGGVIILVLLMLLANPPSPKRSLKLLRLLIYGGCFAALLASLSRTSVAAFFVSLMFIFLIQRKNALIWIASLLVLLVFLMPFMEQLINLILSLRKGSNEGRFALYLYSLRQLEGVDWMLGFGYKPREDTTSPFPIGSHSTYIGLLFKTGGMGSLVFFVFQVVLLIRWYNIKSLVFENPEFLFFWRALGGVFFCMTMWMLTDDLDAPQIVAFLYFSMIGFFEGFRRDLIARQRVGPGPEGRRSGGPSLWAMRWRNS